MLCRTLFLPSFCNIFKVEDHQQALCSCWITLVLDRQCSVLCAIRYPRKTRSAHPAALQGTACTKCCCQCVTGWHLAHTTCCRDAFLFLLLVTLTDGKKTFQSGCKRVFHFFWLTHTYTHRYTLPLKLKKNHNIKHEDIQENTIKDEP